MTDELTKRRDENILKLKAGFDINNNLSIFSPWSYADGWDACQSEMQAQLDESNKALEAQGKAWKQTCELMVFERDELKVQVNDLKKHVSTYIKLADKNAFEASVIGKERDTLKQQLEIAVDTLQDSMEFTSSINDDMNHYFENKCIPTSDEIKQCKIAFSQIRQALTQIKELQGEK